MTQKNFKVLAFFICVFYFLFFIFHFSFAFLPDDPFYSEQWYLSKIKATQAWDLTNGGSEAIIVAVLDTGVDIDHPDLRANIWTNEDEIVADGTDNDNNGYIDDIHGWDFVRNSPDPRPKFDESFNETSIHHGTIVAGQIASIGNNKEGTTGLAYRTKIMPLRVLNSEGQGTVEDVIQAVNYAVANGAKIINLSFVGSDESYFLREALKKAWDKGAVVVAASGNETAATPFDLDLNPAYPVCLDTKNDNFIIGVAASDQNDKKALFSNYGTRCIDLSAPGTRVYGPLVYKPDIIGFDEYYGGYWSGSSVACPLVSATAALIWSINPLFSQEQVRDIILENVDEIDSLNPEFRGKLGQGRLNVYQSVDYAYREVSSLPQNYYIITGARAGGSPHVRVFTSSGFGVTSFFAYNEHFRGGVSVASGDIDGDGKDEIITGAGPGGGPHVRVFDMDGKPKAGFFAYDIRFSGGVSVASGDIDGDGKDEIITGAGPGGGPHVRVFDGQGNLKTQFFAFNKDFYGGVNVASGDVTGNGKDEVIVSVASRASPYVRVFDAELILLRLQFLSFSRDFYQGASLTSADFDGNGASEIITGPGRASLPRVMIFSPQGEKLSEFMAYVKHFPGGVNVATMRASRK